MAACYFAVVRRNRLDSHDLIPRCAIRTRERLRLRLGHAGQCSTKDRMPRRDPKLIVAATRAAEGRRIVAGQRLLVETLKASGKPSEDAEVSLELYISALKVLEYHEQRLREERRAKYRAKPEISKARPHPSG
jgi:hypothetical protein